MLFTELITVLTLWTGVVDATFDVFGLLGQESKPQSLRGQRELAEILIVGDWYRCKQNFNFENGDFFIYLASGENELRWYKNPTRFKSWDGDFNNVTATDCSTRTQGDVIPYNFAKVRQNDTIRCLDDGNKVYRYTGGERRRYRDHATATSWNRTWVDSVYRIDCEDLPEGAPMPFNTTVIEDGESVRCKENSDQQNDTTRIYRWEKENNTLRWYPNRLTALSWNSEYNMNHRWILCYDLKFGDDMKFQTSTIPEGVSAKCRYNSDNMDDPHMVYRYMDGALHWYPCPTIARSWNPQWNQYFMGLDCTDIPIGDDLAYLLENVLDGSSIKCEGDIDPTRVYRFTGNSRRHYPNPQVALSWDESWFEWTKIHCGEIPLGDPMPYNMDIVLDGDSVRCSDNSDNSGDPTRVYRISGNEIRWYPNKRIARSWNKDWRQNVHLVDCSSYTIGNEMQPTDCTASFWGDPHLVTFDGLKYDAQQLGPATLLEEQDSNLIIQGLFVPWRPEKSNSNAVTTAIAIKGKTDEPIIQISVPQTHGFTSTTMWNGCPVDVYLDGVVQAGIDYMDDGAKVEHDDGFIEVTIKDDLGNDYLNANIIVKYNEKIDICFLSGDVRLLQCQTAHNDIKGLFGTPNRNATDDWMNADGIMFEIPRDEDDPMFFKDAVYKKAAYDYSCNWTVIDEYKSILTFEEGKSFEDYANECQEYSADKDQDVLAVMEGKIQDICGDDIGCLIDAGAMGAEGAEQYVENGASERNLILDGNVDAENPAPEDDGDDDLLCVEDV